MSGMGGMRAGIGGREAGALRLRACHHVTSFADVVITNERDHVGGEVNHQYPAQPDVIVDEAHERAGDEPSPLEAGHQERVGVNVLIGRGDLLQQGVHGGPEHPEAGGNQREHGIQVPGLDGSARGEDGDHQGDAAAEKIEQQDQMPAVFAINHHAREGKQQHRGNSLQQQQLA